MEMNLPLEIHEDLASAMKAAAVLSIAVDNIIKRLCRDAAPLDAYVRDYAEISDKLSDIIVTIGNSIGSMAISATFDKIEETVDLETLCDSRP